MSIKATKKKIIKPILPNINIQNVVNLKTRVTTKEYCFLETN